MDDILLNGSDVGVLSMVKEWFSLQFDMRDLGEAIYILGIAETSVFHYHNEPI